MGLTLQNNFKRVDSQVLFKFFADKINFILLNRNKDVHLGLVSGFDIGFFLIFSKKNHFMLYEILIDLVVVDLFFNYLRFKVTYCIGSVFKNCRFFFSLFLERGLDYLASINQIFSASN